MVCALVCEGCWLFVRERAEGSYFWVVFEIGDCVPDFVGCGLWGVGLGLGVGAGLLCHLVWLCG